MASTANWKYKHRQRGDTNAQTDGDRSKNDHSGTTDELFGRVDTQQMEGQQWRRQIANPLPKKYQLLSARQKYSVSVIVVRRSLDYRFEEPFLPEPSQVPRPTCFWKWVGATVCLYRGNFTLRHSSAHISARISKNAILLDSSMYQEAPSPVSKIFIHPWLP